MGYHNNEETTRKAVKDACRFINDRERYKHALGLCLDALGINADAVIAEVRGADFSRLKYELNERT